MRKEYNKSLLIFCAFVYLAVEITCFPVIDLRTNTILRGDYLICMAASVAGILLINAIFKRFGKIVSPLAIIGRNAMSLYVWHFILLTVSTPVFRDVMGISYPNYTVICNVAFLSLVMPFIVYLSKRKCSNYFKTLVSR